MVAAQQPVNYKALSWTAGVHLVILLLLLIWKFGTPAPMQAIPEMGMEVNLGSSDNGLGTDQPMDMEDPANAVAATNARSTAATASNDRDIEQTDDKDAPEVAPPHPAIATPVRPTQAVTPPRTNRTATTAQPATHTATPQVQRPRFVYQGSNGRGGNGAQANAPGGNEGNTFGNGDRGVPHGTPGAPNYTGSPGNGTGGISFSLDGRNMIATPNPEAEFRQGGKVVVRITVNRDGAIINKSVLSSSNAELSPIALRKLQSVKFNKSENAPAEQFGKITFVFKTRS